MAIDPFFIYNMLDNDDSSSSSDDDDPVMQQYVLVANQLFGDVPIDHISARAYINRNREAAHERLMADYFVQNPLYGADIFKTRFRMSKRLFLIIVNDMANNFEYFIFRTDARGRQSFTALQKCTSAIRQLAYGTVPDAIDEYLQMSERTSRESLHQFCSSIISLYGKNLDCTHWEWRNCPRLYRGHYMRGDHKHPTIVLEAVASQDQWIWHSFFRVAGSNNDINVLRQSPLFNDVINEAAPVVPFEVNGVTYRHGYFLGDGIYPPWSTIVKSFSFPSDEKQIRFKGAQEAARKDVERTYGRHKGKWQILAQAARAFTPAKIRNIMYACCILHNMTLEDKGKAICPYYENEVPTQEEVMARNQNILGEIMNRQLHFNLQADLVEHIRYAYVPRLDGNNQNNENNEDSED